jgi:hypothetical protein
MEEQQAMIEIRILDNFPSLGGLTLHSVELQPGDRLVILEAPSRKSDGRPRMIDSKRGEAAIRAMEGRLVRFSAALFDIETALERARGR